MPIPKSDREVLADIPQWLLKKLAKVDPSPITGGDGEGIYYIGRFSDVWAPDDLRNRELYYAHAKTVLSPSLAFAEDPLFSQFATELCQAFVLGVCGPRRDASWANCLDSQFEEAGAGCFRRNTVGGFTYQNCLYSEMYAPVMFIFDSTPSSNTDVVSVEAYSKPCPVHQDTPLLSEKYETSGRVLLRAVGCDDADNKVRYVRYISDDRHPTSYIIAALGIGGIIDSYNIRIFARYSFPSPVIKNTNDYYIFTYTIGFQYQ
jgi:hypothetical protein